jgi:integrase
MEQTVQPTSLADVLTTWAALQGIGKKDSTREYHQEIIGIVLNRWPGPCDDVRAVTEKTLTSFVLDVSAAYSASRYNGILSAIHGVFPDSRKKFKRQRVLAKERHVLTDSEFSQLIEELDRAPRSHAGLVVRFLAETGMRIGESRRLTWSCVKADRIVVPGAIAKNGRMRTIPFMGRIAETLAALRALAKTDLVLPQAEVQTSLRSACERLGLPRLSHHDFRHQFATRAITSGIDLPTVARWLGHLDGGALLSRLYFHLVEEHSFRMAAKAKLLPMDRVAPKVAFTPALPANWQN